MTRPVWDDLAPRLASGAALAILGGAAVIAGGAWLNELAVLAVGIMSWELARITAAGHPRDAVLVGLFAAAMLTLVLWRHDPYWMPFLAAPALLAWLRASPGKLQGAGIALAIMMTGYGIVALRSGYGLSWIVWLILVVAAVDILGYFGGRLIGGPKFWPAISPKKTWSGTVAGWAGAAAVGAAAWALADAPVWIIPFSALVGLASQLGDIAESAVKRRAGVKDASNLIPGHGGLMDRFDGLSGAVVFCLVWAQLLPLPQVGG
jgi:phosphatidate cytidylyltransferase